VPQTLVDVKDGDCPQHWIFENKKFNSLWGLHCQNFIKIGQTEIWQFLDYSNMAAVRHVGFVGSIFGLPWKST